MKRLFPAHWVVRKLPTDFGLDFEVEVFDYVPDAKPPSLTRGEHFYVQVKTTRSTTVRAVRVRSTDKVTIDVTSEVLNMSDLVTVQVMGPAVPVLLVQLDESADLARFVCLSDYVDKIVAPEEPGFAEAASRTVYLPAANVLGEEGDNLEYLYFLARRPKLFAIFNTLTFMQDDVNRRFDGDDLQDRRYWSDEAGATSDTRRLSEETVELLRKYVSRALQWDIWDSPGSIWQPLEWWGEELVELEEELRDHPVGMAVSDLVDFGISVQRVFNQGAALSREYEDRVREWFLPTHLSNQLTGRT